jgi:trehalose 6-phosphate synthase
LSAPDLLIASNRGPYVYERSGTGFTARRGGGGVSGSLGPVLSELGGCWIASALGDGDREFAREFPHGRQEDGFHLRLLDIPPDLHHLHYEVVSNEYLWFLFHYLFDVPSEPVFDRSFAAAWDGYRRVNEIYADAVIGTRAGAVLFQDYQLILAGRMVRQKSKAKRPLLYFHHTPWCEPTYFSLLPDDIATEILEAMLAYDVVGFHSRRWADAFVACCERFLSRVSLNGDTISYKRRTTRVLVAPVPVDAERLSAQAHDPASASWISSHDAMREGRKLLLRVDRIDLSKNPYRGFLAFEKLLERDPKRANDVVFLALLYPSRLSVERYQRYFADCLGVVRRVNDRFSKKLKAEVGPIHLLFEDDYNRSLAAMRLYDVLLVNPVFDGLNLVAKEGPAINERSGSVLLSRNAGVFEEIGPATIPLNPFDVSATTDAMEEALDRGADERKTAANKLRRLATRSSPTAWLRTQLEAAGL